MSNRFEYPPPTWSHHTTTPKHHHVGRCFAVPLIPRLDVDCESPVNTQKRPMQLPRRGPTVSKVSPLAGCIPCVYRPRILVSQAQRRPWKLPREHIVHLHHAPADVFNQVEMISDKLELRLPLLLDLHHDMGKGIRIHTKDNHTSKVGLSVERDT